MFKSVYRIFSFQRAITSSLFRSLSQATNSLPPERIRIKNLLAKLAKDGLKGQGNVTLMGWVKTIRKQKQYTFIQINDGSNLQGIQGVIDNKLGDICDLTRLY